MTARRRLRRHGAGLALLLFTGMALCAPREFDIPAGPAEQTLTRFAQQAGVPVLFPYELLQGRRTRTLRGRLEVQPALQQLIAGSGLTAYLDPRGQITLRLAERAVAAPATAAPQDLPAPDEPTSLPAEDLPEVSITGTRIQRENLSTPTPVAAISRVELDAIGPTLLVDALVQLPLFLNSDTPQTQSFGTSGAAGASFLNLRGIGSVRTLTLLDGRRVVPSSRSGTVDVALLPRSVVRRVEVVTGGASAAYGSDAVSGVVNMLLDADFRGLRGHVQGGITGEGDNANAEFGAAWGLTLGERSTLLLSGEYSRIEGIRGYDSRDWFNSTASIANPGGDPREVLVGNVRATGYTYGGLITSGPLAGTQFLAGGVPAPFEAGQYRTATTQSGGSGVDPAADLIWIVPDQRRVSSFARFTTRPSDTLTTFAQAIAGQTRNAFDKDPPSLWGPWEATIFRDNAFLPQVIRDRMDSAGVSSFRLGRVGAGDLGRAHATLTGNLLSGTVGATWQQPGWSLDGYYQIGRDHTRLRYEDTLRIDRVYRGVDAVVDPASGRTVCRSTLTFANDGCVPVNLLGPGSVSEAARAWITEGSAEQLQDVREQVAEMTLHADVPLLPAGRASIATGVSWRLESADSRSRRLPESLEGLRVEPAASAGYRGLPAAYSDSANIFERTVTVDVAGQYSVREIFGEALVPLLRDAPLARRVDLHAALRQARYSGSGTVLAWKLGAEWQPIDSLGLRATRSRDVRAGSLAERYDLSTAGVTIVDTVLAGRPSYAVISQREGNPAVDPELSDTHTAGIIIRPSGWPGVSLTADYYDIRIRDVIALSGTQNIINSCAAGNASACGLIERSDSGLITRVHNRILNIAGARSRGIDLELGWRTPLAWFGGAESLAARAFVTRTLESSTTDATGTRNDRAGQTGLFGGAPRLQATLSVAYERGPLNVGIQQRYVSSGSYDATFGAADLADRHVRAATYTTLRLAFSPRGGRGTTWYLNIQNLFDAAPPRSGDWGFGGSIPTNEGLFDVLGRRFVAGVRLDL
ncbi:MAG: TonB-dependent receptor [Proteobacteria bacterium]|nr:TonB-dependent receptor [Pseudomonadota bacterium]